MALPLGAIPKDVGDSHLQARDSRLTTGNPFISIFTRRYHLGFHRSRAIRTCELWNLATQSALPALRHENTLVCAVFSPDGNILASGSITTDTVILWDMVTRQRVGTLSHNQLVASLAFSPDGRTLAVGCGSYTGGEIKLWNVLTHTELGTLSGHTARVAAVQFSPDGKTLASGSWDRTVKLWDLETHQEIRTLRGIRPVSNAWHFLQMGTPWPHVVKTAK